MNKKIYLITDRGITLSDSVSRYIIDLYKSLETIGYEPTIYSTQESRIKTHAQTTNDSLRIIKGVPNVNDKAVFHFHLTFSIREHTKYLIRQVGKLHNKAIVIFHTDTKYAENMGQESNVKQILGPLVKNNVLGYCFSNYSRANFLKHGFKKMYVVYPGLNLSVYDSYNIFNKQECALFLASNPDNQFIGEIKGQYLYNEINKILGNSVNIVQKANIPFAELLEVLSKCKYYLALGEYEHYGFSIIDAFNLGCIPIYRNEGGLVEAVHSRGYPMFVENKRIISSGEIEYNKEMVISNIEYSRKTHSIIRHTKTLATLYKSLSI